MLAGRIALWGLAFLIESDSTRLSQGKQLDFAQFLVSQPNRSSAACITSMDGQRRRELLDGIIADDTPFLFSFFICLQISIERTTGYIHYAQVIRSKGPFQMARYPGAHRKRRPAALTAKLGSRAGC
jgi:hypothetical protein